MPLHCTAIPDIDRYELATILAALRLLQETPALPEAIEEIATEEGDFERLDADRIDALCERINAVSEVPVAGRHRGRGARGASRRPVRGDRPMIRQYHAQRHRRIDLAGRIRDVGTVPVGTIALVRGRKIRVEAWLPREYATVERGRVVTKRIAGGHLAQVRDLATGRVGPLSDAFLVDAAAIVTEEPSGRALRRLARMRDRGSNATAP